mmetsp:Transcript_16753/g.46603  ORF Transcript_16753/g.46603 Transcript_16753/m.46603 type:complete len:219 (+) Transcript_16753:1826-2482(+)
MVRPVVLSPPTKSTTGASSAVWKSIHRRCSKRSKTSRSRFFSGRFCRALSKSFTAVRRFFPNWNGGVFLAKAMKLAVRPARPPSSAAPPCSEFSPDAPPSSAWSAASLPCAASAPPGAFHSSTSTSILTRRPVRGRRNTAPLPLMPGYRSPFRNVVQPAGTRFRASSTSVPSRVTLLAHFTELMRRVCSSERHWVARSLFLSTKRLGTKSSSSPAKMK